MKSKLAVIVTFMLVGASTAHAQNPVVNFGINKAAGAAGNVAGGTNLGAATTAGAGAATGGVVSGVVGGALYPNRTASDNQEASHILQGSQNSPSRYTPPANTNNPAVNTSRTAK